MKIEDLIFFFKTELVSSSHARPSITSTGWPDLTPNTVKGLSFKIAIKETICSVQWRKKMFCDVWPRIVKASKNNVALVYNAMGIDKHLQVISAPSSHILGNFL